MSKPWERHWYVVQAPPVEALGEHAGQWWVYSSDTPDKDDEGGGPLFGYRGPPIPEEEARFAAKAPALYRALDTLATAVRTGSATGVALLAAERAMADARGDDGWAPQEVICWTCGLSSTKADPSVLASSTCAHEWLPNAEVLRRGIEKQLEGNIRALRWALDEQTRNWSRVLAEVRAATGATADESTMEAIARLRNGAP